MNVANLTESQRAAYNRNMVANHLHQDTYPVNAYKSAIALDSLPQIQPADPRMSALIRSLNNVNPISVGI